MGVRSGRLVVVSGASQSGKTSEVIRRLQGRARVLVWDPEDQWGRRAGWQRVTTRHALLHRVTAEGERNGRIAYVAGGDLVPAFQFWAGCAFYWGRWHGPCAIVAEEISDVTHPGKAPGKWGLLIRRGLKRGIDIFAISQRWAESDKTAVNNASDFLIFRPLPGDLRYVAGKSGAPADLLAKLRGHQYITVDAVRGKVSRIQGRG